MASVMPFYFNHNTNRAAKRKENTMFIGTLKFFAALAVVLLLLALSQGCISSILRAQM
jgi:hypothetical protein